MAAKNRLAWGYFRFCCKVSCQEGKHSLISPCKPIVDFSNYFFFHFEIQPLHVLSPGATHRGSRISRPTKWRWSLVIRATLDKLLTMSCFFSISTKWSTQSVGNRWIQLAVPTTWIYIYMFAQVYNWQRLKIFSAGVPLAFLCPPFVSPHPLPSCYKLFSPISTSKRRNAAIIVAEKAPTSDIWSAHRGWELLK